MIGKFVIGDSGCMHPERKGQIISQESIRWGETYLVVWEDGALESFFKHQIKPITEKNGIGVYHE